MRGGLPSFAAVLDNFHDWPSLIEKVQLFVQRYGHLEAYVNTNMCRHLFPTLGIANRVQLVKLFPNTYIVGESGVHSRMGHIRFFRFVGIRMIVRPQCKSAEYYFHHRPSFAIESSIIFLITFYKI